MSMVTFGKPTKHVALPEWYARTREMCQTADTRQSDSFNLRAEGRQLRGETVIKTKWDTYRNDARLHDRVTELSRWQEVLEQCLQAVENESAKLTEEKAITERELEFLVTHLNTVAECIRQRDKRYGNDLVLSDKGDAELKSELGVIEHLKDLLASKCHAAWEEQNRLSEVRIKLQLDIGDKKDTLAVDIENCKMTKHCAGTSYKPDPLRIPKRCIPYEAWLEHSRYSKLNTDNEISASRRLREAMFSLREKSRNDLQSQHDSTDYALRHRIYETQREKNELQWQHQKIMNEMEKMLKEVTNLEQSVLDKTNSVKLVETRLENRMFRPGAELVQDDAQSGLVDEALQLRQTCQDLFKKIDDGKETYNALEAHLICLDQDVINKEHTLMTDLRCLKMRSALKRCYQAAPATQTERNIQLTRVAEEVSQS